MIELIDVHKRFRTAHGRSRWILSGIDLRIPARRSVALIGANGAGKSTLLRLIGGIDQPTKGRVLRHCRTSWPMGLGGGIQGALTGRQNARFVCRVHGSESDVLQKIEFIAEFADIGAAFDEPINSYSSGMQARLKFAMSMAFDFDVYLVDELTAVGDAAFRRKTLNAFRQLAGHGSVIMVSHSEATLREYCASGILLQQGKAHWFDELDDALAKYKEDAHP
jgi:capsular polysaccharide transport system ATP-binding protein